MTRLGLENRITRYSIQQVFAVTGHAQALLQREAKVSDADFGGAVRGMESWKLACPRSWVDVAAFAGDAVAQA